MFMRYPSLATALTTALAAPAMLLMLTCGGPEAMEVLRPELAEPVLPQARPVRVVERHAIPPAPRHPLERFFRALQRVEDGDAAADVRVLHMGASHTASDTVTGPLRLEFARQFGDGGRGYLHPGVPWRRYRQLSANYDMQGEWIVHNGMRRDAVQPFGLSGIRIESSEEGAWFERASCPDCELGQTMNEWALHYLRVPGGGSFRVHVDGAVIYRFRARLGHGRALRDPRGEVIFEPAEGAPVALTALVPATSMCGPFTLVVRDERGVVGEGVLRVRIEVRAGGRTWPAEATYPTREIAAGRFGPDHWERLHPEEGPV